VIGMGAALAASPVAATTPARLWTGVTRFYLQCVAGPEVDARLSDRLCARAMAELRAATTRPAMLLAPGERVPAARDAAVLTFRLSAGAQPVATLAVRRALAVDESEAGLDLPPVALPAGRDRLAPVAALIRRAVPGSGPTVSTKGKTE
jgi:hypothetical protein